MADLTALAASIRDSAVTLAKRYGNDSVMAVHLAAAIRLVDEDNFDTRFPELSGRLEALLAQGRSDSLKRPVVSDDMTEILATVRRSEDALSLCTELLAELPEIELPVATGSPAMDDTPSDPGRAGGTGAAHLLLNRSLAEEIAAVTGDDVEVVAGRMFADAVAVATDVVGTPTDALLTSLTSSLGIDLPAELPDLVLSNAVGEIAHSGSVDAAKVATALALALVDVGEWAAAMDQHVSREETDRIDAIRLRLRDQLGDNLKAESDAFTEFDESFSSLIGMNSVKDELRKRAEFLVVSKRRAGRGHNVEPQRLHMAFLGNPGTGKTTVARLYGSLLHNLGLLPSNRMIEKDRSGLIGQYVGQTEKKTLEVIEQADGGVLFVDEAYALADRYYSGAKGYGEEATDVLVKQMEDRRDRLVVILAGYSEPMENFLSMNVGLRSRIPTILTFPDYSDDELVSIAERIAARRDLSFSAEALEKVRAVLGRERGKDGFGNAREVENLIDAAQRNVTARVSELGNLATREETSTILPEDLPEATEAVAKRPIGFQPTRPEERAN